HQPEVLTPAERRQPAAAHTARRRPITASAAAADTHSRLPNEHTHIRHHRAAPTRLRRREHVTTEAAVVVAVPDSVRGELRRGVGSVLVDAAALRQVRERFDDGQASALSRYLEASQSPNTL